MQKNITNCTSTVIESPIKKDSDIKRRSTHVRSLTYEESEQSSLDTPTKRPVRRAASIRSKTKYRESPEKIDISSDDEGSDNYDLSKEPASSESSDTDDSVVSDDIPSPSKENSVKCNKRFTLKKSKAQKSSRSEQIKHNSAIKKKQMTPRIPSRKIPLPSIVSPLQEAQMRLHVAAVPQDLPCREEEFYEILAFTEGKIVDGTGGCMYISGLPGTNTIRFITAVFVI